VRERVTALAPIVAVGGLFGVCCGLPVLLSVGVLGALAGVSVSSWLLIALGLGVAVLGSVRWVRHRRITPGAASCAPTTHPTAPRTTAPRTTTARISHHPIISITKEHHR
jgi:hypothetical protein